MAELPKLEKRNRYRVGATLAVALAILAIE
jgi:hypothetical protein